MNFGYPLPNFNWKENTTQLFGVNYALYNPNFGLPGHNGLDLNVPTDPKKGYGTPILASHDGYISRLNYETNWKTNGNGIYLTTLDGKYTSLYWHLSEIQVRIGQQVKQGDVIGLMGNTGFVKPEPISSEPYNGTHLHFGVYENGKDNEYGGAIDPTPLIFKEGDKLPIYWIDSLWYGKSGDNVSWLQTCLKLFGYAKDYEPIGYFGTKTLRDVRQYQLDRGITPAVGYFGEKTKAGFKRFSSYYD